MTDHPSDARVTGEGDVGAGTYWTITINGAGTITGDVQCHELRINGVGACKGAVRADAVTVNGAGTFEGPVQASEFIVNGTSDVHAGMGVGRLRVAGTCTIDGGLAAHEVELRGELRSGSGLETRNMTGEGRLVTHGAIRAETIDVRLHGRSSASSIVCGRIFVKAPEGITAILSAFTERRLVVDTIEAGEIELVNTTAKVVRGDKVTLGEGCEVDVVEYAGVLQTLAGAQVREGRKVESGRTAPA